MRTMTHGLLRKNLGNRNTLGSLVHWQYCSLFFPVNQSILIITEDVTETVMHVPHITAIATVAGITVTDINGAVSAEVMAEHLENAVGIKNRKGQHDTVDTMSHPRLI